MKLNVNALKSILLMEKFRGLGNLKKLCMVFAFSNIFTCSIFYLWFIFHSYNNTILPLTYLLIAAIAAHTYLFTIISKWSLLYEDNGWMMWTWISLIPVTPLGVGLIAVINKPVTWQVTENEEAMGKSSLFNSFSNSFIITNRYLKESIDYMESLNGDWFKDYLTRGLGLQSLDPNTWDNRSKFSVIALHEALRQNKKKATLNDFAFRAHWYDNRYFDFALKDPRATFMPVKHKYIIAFIILDESNNYRKILEAKKELKGNLKFSSAKMICLHWGKGSKLYANE